TAATGTRTVPAAASAVSTATGSARATAAAGAGAATAAGTVRTAAAPAECRAAGGRAGRGGRAERAGDTDDVERRSSGAGQARSRRRLRSAHQGAERGDTGIRSTRFLGLQHRARRHEQVPYCDAVRLVRVVREHGDPADGADGMGELDEPDWRHDRLSYRRGRANTSRALDHPRRAAGPAGPAAGAPDADHGYRD